MSLVRCKDCGCHFERAADEAWKVRCVPCYKKAKRAESTPVVIESSYWIDRAAALQSQVATLQSQILQLQNQLAQQQFTIRILSNRPAAAAPSRLDRELAENWRALIQLAHPDKHNGSQGATRMTQWLNEIKGRLPCA